MIKDAAEPLPRTSGIKKQESVWVTFYLSCKRREAPEWTASNYGKTSACAFSGSVLVEHPKSS